MDETTRVLHSVDLGRVVRQRWRLILASVAVALCLGGLYYLSAEKLYESRVEILVMKKDPATTSVSGGQSSEMQSDVVEDVLATHIRLFGSARVVLDAVEAHQLDQLPGIASRLDDDLTAVNYILDHLEVGRGGEGQARDAQVLYATFKHADPEETQQVLGVLVESYQEFLAETFNDVGSEALALFKKATDDLGSDLEKTENEYAQFRGTAPLMFAGDESFSVHERELLELSTARVELQQQKTMIESRLDSIRQAVDGADADKFTDAQRLALIDDEHVQRLSLMVNVERGDAVSEAFQAEQPARSEAASAEYDKLVSLKTEAEILVGKFGAQHPRIAEVRATIAQLEGFLDSRGVLGEFEEDKFEPREVVAAYRKLLENDLIHIQRRLVELDKLIATASAEAKKLDVVEARAEMLASQLQRKRDLYNQVFNRITEVDMATDFGSFQTPVLDPVSAAPQVWPNLLIIGALSLVLGFGSGLGLALWNDLNDHTFQTADEVAHTIHAPVLGVVPRIEPDTEGAAVESAIDSKIVALHRSKSTDAEAIRSVRTALFFASHGAGRNVIQFTSPTPADGKSLMSANVAVALASAGKRVLLIDADLRKPTQHTLFGVIVGAGLADLLVDDVEFPDVVQATGVENLDLLPAGTLPPNPAELLSMPRFDEFLQARREQYDYVIVDTPPVLVVSDPLNVAPMVDGVILVTPVKQNMAGAAKHAARMLRDIDATVLGGVVNDLESRFESAASQYGGYGAGYTYGYTDDTSGYTSRETTTVS